MSTRVLRVCVLMALTAVMLSLAVAPVLASNGSVAPKVRLGAFLAGDRSLSDPDGQACADCHFPRAGYADPDQDLPVSQGVLPGLFGGRNAPTWAYTAGARRSTTTRPTRPGSAACSGTAGPPDGSSRRSPSRRAARS